MNVYDKKPQCSNCGSSHLNYEAIVSWSEGREAFEIEEVSDPISCRDCESSLIREER